MSREQGTQSDSLMKMTRELAQMTGFLRAHVAGQEKTNDRLMKLLDKVTANQAAQADRLTKVEGQAACVPELKRQQGRTNRLLWMGAGAVSLISIITTIIGPVISQALAKLIK